MDYSSSTLKSRARSKLQGQYGQAIVVSLLYSGILSLCSGGSIFTSIRAVFSQMESFSAMGGSNAYSDAPFNFSVSYSPLSSLGSLAVFLLMGPLMVGLAHYFLHVADQNNPQISDLFGHFKHFGNTFVLYLLTVLFVFLWSLLFIIPGIIAGISYSMAPFILAEHPEIKASDALKMSKDMMKGHKGDYFILQLSFIGWFLLCLLTAGIGFIFLTPYVEAANAEFFNEVSGKNVEKQRMGFNPDGSPAFAGYGAPNGYAQPASNNYGQPNAGGYAQQAPNGYAQPDPNSYGQPNAGGYAQQAPNGGAQPDTGGYPPYHDPNGFGNTP